MLRRSTRGPTLTQRGAAFVTSGLILLLAGLALGQPDLTRIGLLLLLLLALAWAMGRMRPPRFTVSRTVAPARISVDELTWVSALLHNDAGRPSSFAVAEERLDAALGDRPRFVIPPTSAGATREIDYSIRPHHRGLHPLGPLMLWVRDPFGLTSVPTLTRGTAGVLVAPRIHPLATDRALGRGVGAEGSIPHQVALHGEEDQSIREYREGDDLRRIHWPATARTGSIMVRQEDRPARRRAVILLDSRASAHGATASSRTTPGFEWAVSMAASVAGHVTDRRYAVHLLSADPSLDVGVRRDDHLDAMLDTLAQIELTTDHGWSATVHAAHGVVQGGGLLVALVAPLADEESRSLAALRQTGSTALAFVLSHGRDESSQKAADQTVAVLSAAGWRAVAVRPTDPPARSWALATGTMSPVGAP